MFAKKPKQLKDAKCDGCGLDPHTGDCVQQTNQQRRREEMGPRRQILNRHLVKTTDKEEIVRLLQAFGEEQGRLALGSGRDRGNARGEGKGGNKATGKQIARPMTEKMKPKDQEICKKHDICKWHAMYGDCKFGTLCRSSHLSR